MASDEIEALFEEWGEENVRKAFWLQNHIKRNGVKGIHFMHPGDDDSDSAETLMREAGPSMAKTYIEAELEDVY